jgi:hypothetical protein
MNTFGNKLLETFPVGTAEERKEVKRLRDFIERNFKFDLNNYAAAVKHRDDPFSDEHIQSVYVVVKECYRNQFGNIELIDIGHFKRTINANKETIQELNKYRLEDVNRYNVRTIENEIGNLYMGLNLAPNSKSRLVPCSMTMHLLLPDLLMPINITHTLKFFDKHITNRPGESKTEHARRELKPIYIDIFEQTQEYSLALKPKEDFLTSGWSRNIPKFIDGLIIAYTKTNDVKLTNKDSDKKFSTTFSRGSKSDLIRKIIKENPHLTNTEVCKKVMKMGFETCYDSEVRRIRK